jgi:hypothetical protein
MFVRLRGCIQTDFPPANFEPIRFQTYKMFGLMQMLIGLLAIGVATF